MSDVKDTGGPAFPFSFMVGDEHRWAHGMHLRDYFAAEAMKGMLASCTGWSEAQQERLAKCSYSMADEMLEARKNV